MLKHIPNLITSLNLFSGCIGVVFAFQGNLEWSVYCIWIAMGFDFFDGFAARMLNVSSPIGKELDSLADMVTFGFLPSVILYQFFETGSHISYLAFLVAIFSAFRLAKFNVDENQSDSFIGVPTPANALFISSIVFLIKEYPIIENESILISLSIICSIWLVAPVKLLALKFKSFQIKGNQFRYLLIIVSVILIFGLEVASIPLIILTYIVISLVNNLTESNNKND